MEHTTTKVDRDHHGNLKADTDYDLFTDEGIQHFLRVTTYKGMGGLLTTGATVYSRPSPGCLNYKSDSFNRRVFAQAKRGTEKAIRTQHAHILENVDVVIKMALAHHDKELGGVYNQPESDSATALDTESEGGKA